MHANEKIAAGIKARDLSQLNTRSLESYVGKPQSLSGLIETASKADLVAQRFTKTIERLSADLATEAKRAAEQYEALTSLPKMQRDALQREHMAKFRLELVKNSSQERFEILKEVREHADNMSAVADLYANPVVMLVQHESPDNARDRYAQRLQSAGPTELTVMAKRAASLRDKDLAAAVAQRYDSLPNDQRKRVGFSKNDLAAVVMGEEYEKARSALAIAKGRFQESINANRAFESGKNVSGVTIRQALDRKAEGHALDSPEE